MTEEWINLRELTEQEIVRRQKAEKIKELGIDPFGNRFDRTAFAMDLKEKYKYNGGDCNCCGVTKNIKEWAFDKIK